MNLTHDRRQGKPLDPLVDLTHRLQTSRAKQLALFEAKVIESDGDESPPKRTSLGPSSHPSEDSPPASMVLARQGEGGSMGSRWASRS